MTLPNLADAVRYRSRTGKYFLAAMVTATQETLYRVGVDEGHVPYLTDEHHVHLAVFTPGKAGHRNSTTTETEAEAMRALSAPAGGTYQEWNVPEDQSGETPGSWSWASGEQAPLT